jgi:hypothetical protein
LTTHARATSKVVYRESSSATTNEKANHSNKAEYE